MDNKVKFQIQFRKENNRIELLNRVQVLDRFFNHGRGDLCKDCSAGDLCSPKVAKPSSSKSWKRQGNEIIGNHLNAHHGHKYQVHCINIRRRSGSKNRQKNESTGQAKLQTAVQSSLIVNNADTASNGQRPDETEPTEATLLLSEHLKNMSSHLSTELSHREYCQLSEQFKQQLSREISELKNKLDLISDRYNLATDFSTGPANPPPYPADPFSQLSNILPFNSFVLIPVSLTQPPVSLALNQLNQTQLKGPTQLDTLLANQSRPNSDRLPFQTSNRTAVGHQLGCSGYSSSTSFSSHYLCDDNFSRVRDLDEINQSRSLVNSIQAGSQQQQQSISTTKS